MSLNKINKSFFIFIKISNKIKPISHIFLPKWWPWSLRLSALGYLTGLIHVHVYIVTRYQLVKYNNMYHCGKFFFNGGYRWSTWYYLENTTEQPQMMNYFLKLYQLSTPGNGHQSKTQKLFFFKTEHFYLCITTRYLEVICYIN
jgi:hypothetical protein